MYDILIKNGHIIDGTGSPEMKAQIAIKDGKIVKIALCDQLQRAVFILDVHFTALSSHFVSGCRRQISRNTGC